ncbi:MAG TPA: DNA double-strand break repair nuclease NurA [Firmicutes bacterium]|nr:DNA double-strand break repair nuclease NurA [Bacillota bacterium]
MPGAKEVEDHRKSEKTEGLRRELAHVQLVLDERAQFLRAQRHRLRALLGEKVGKLRRLRRLEPAALGEWLGGRPVAGVDGSCNSVGAAYPHYITLLVAAARCTTGQETWVYRVWSPLTSGEARGQEADDMARRHALSVLEAQVAEEALTRFQPRLLLVDGPLVRLRIEAQEEWEALFRQALAQQVILVGVIESVGTSLLAPLLGEVLPPTWADAHDRELLWGLLEPGEMLTVAHPHKPGLRSCFLRPSLDPAPVGLDFPALAPWPGTDIETVADVLYTLTPEKGRGIPVWVDLVDSLVRLDDRLVEALVAGGISRENWLRFFAPKRARRPF